jgi:hypothetical protein
MLDHRKRAKPSSPRREDRIAQRARRRRDPCLPDTTRLLITFDLVHLDLRNFI